MDNKFTAVDLDTLALVTGGGDELPANFKQATPGQLADSVNFYDANVVKEGEPVAFSGKSWCNKARTVCGFSLDQPAQPVQAK
jgi:hypothetical protein